MTSLRSFIKQLLAQRGSITIVSGLPRSGTSMMMSALAAGGMQLLTDGEREADANNPKGYFEYERVKKLAHGDMDWLADARGKAVKIISALLFYLPSDYPYRVIFLERSLEEILASQTRMLERTGKHAEQTFSEEQIRASYQNHLIEVKSWLDDQENVKTLYVSYNETVLHPLLIFREVASFLDGLVDPTAMITVIDPKLHREKKPSSK